MTPADRRITELIEKWLASIDLHLKYVELSDAAYARVQAWPKHDRPTRWVLEVARQKILELKAHCETRQAMGDGKFSESLELMAFLANLVGIQHIQRFVPLADPSRTEPVVARSRAEGLNTTASPQPTCRPASAETPPGVFLSATTSYSRTRPPAPRLARSLPSGLNARPTKPAPGSALPSSFRLPVARSQSTMGPAGPVWASRSPARSREPS